MPSAGLIDKHAHRATADHKPPVAEGPVEFACKILCRLGVAGLIGIIDLELITRNLLGFSFNVSDEYSGYILVLLTFLSLPLCVVHGSFHRVTFVLARFPARVQTVMLLVFDVLALVFAAVILWESTLLVLNSEQLGTTAPTLLMTPLWLPQLAMPIGAAALCWTLVRVTIAHARRLLRTLPAANPAGA